MFFTTKYKNVEFYKKILYPDGDFYIELIKPTIDFTFRINKPEDLWELYHLVDVLNHNNVKPIITIPNLLSGQGDRRFAPNQSSGLKLVCKFLNNMKANFKIFHPHNAEVVEALMDNVEIIDNSVFIESVLYKIRKDLSVADGRSIDETLTILLPDGGAFKWGAKLADKIEFKGDVINASKFRKDGKVDKQELPNYNFEGKDILIVDDICIYGGTFKGLAKLLRERNCGKLYLAVSHITVQNHEKDNVFSYFDRVFTTNSKYDVYYERIDGSSGKEIKNLDIIKMF